MKLLLTSASVRIVNPVMHLRMWRQGRAWFGLGHNSALHLRERIISPNTAAASIGRNLVTETSIVNVTGLVATGDANHPWNARFKPCLSGRSAR